MRRILLRDAYLSAVPSADGTSALYVSEPSLLQFDHAAVLYNGLRTLYFGAYEGEKRVIHFSKSSEESVRTVRRWVEVSIFVSKVLKEDLHMSIASPSNTRGLAFYSAFRRAVAAPLVEDIEYTQALLEECGLAERGEESGLDRRRFSLSEVSNKIDRSVNVARILPLSLTKLPKKAMRFHTQASAQRFSELIMETNGFQEYMKNNAKAGLDLNLVRGGGVPYPTADLLYRAYRNAR